MHTMKSLSTAVAAAFTLAWAAPSPAQDFAMSLAMPDPAAPAAPAKIAQATPPQTAQPSPSKNDRMNDAASSPSTASGSTSAHAGTRLSLADRRFIEKAAKGGMAEVELGKLAQQRAASEQVKQFGSRMVEDHGKAIDQLKRLAESKGVTLPTEPDASETRLMHKLQNLSGAEFDRVYMKEMLSDHKKDVSEFKSKANGARDADVKSFAETTLPTLQQHLDLAQSVEAATRTAAQGNRARPSTTRGPALPPPPSVGT